MRMSISGCLSRERANIPGLHQLYRWNIWVFKGAVGSSLWSGNNSTTALYPFFRNFFHVQISGSNDQNAILVMQMIVILTKSIERCFEKNAKFDMTPLLGGTDAVFSSLVHSFSWFVSDLPLNHLPFTLFSC